MTPEEQQAFSGAIRDFVRPTLCGNLRQLMLSVSAYSSPKVHRSAYSVGDVVTINGMAHTCTGVSPNRLELDDGSSVTFS
jgi:hypothetical protein